MLRALVNQARSWVQRRRYRQREATWRQLSASQAYVQHEVGPGLVLDLPARSELSRLVYVYDLEGTERLLLAHLLRPGDFFVDVGANFGLYTVDAATRVGPSGAVLAFEPGANAHAHLLHNIARAKLGNVEARKIALSDREGHAVLNVSRDGRDAWNTLGASLDESARDGEDVPTQRLDTVLEARPRPSPAMMKVDVEGWECQVLAGAERLLAGPDAPILQVEFAQDYFAANGVSIERLRDSMVKHGYELFQPAGANSLRPLRPGVEELSGNLYAAKINGPWFPRIQALLRPDADGQRRA